MNQRITIILLVVLICLVLYSILTNHNISTITTTTEIGHEAQQYPSNSSSGTADPPPGGPGRVGLIYNSRSGIQAQLYVAAWIGFRDSLPAAAAVEIDNNNGTSISLHNSPHFIDLANFTDAKQAQGLALGDVAEWLISNHTTSIVSLLETKQLANLLKAYQNRRQALQGSENQINHVLRVVLPRSCAAGVLQNSLQGGGGGDSLFQIDCLQMGQPGIAAALLHHASQVGVTNLMQIIEPRRKSRGSDPAKVYEQLFGKRAKPRSPGNFTLESPQDIRSLRAQFTEITTRDDSDNSTATATAKSNPKIGILLLTDSRKTTLQVLSITNSLQAKAGYVIPVLSPWGLDTFGEEAGTAMGGMHSQHEGSYSNGLYTVVYAAGAGTGKWDNPARRILLKELSEFMGPSPLITTAVLAYEAARKAVTQAKHPAGLPDGRREFPFFSVPSAGTFFGISPKPLGAVQSIIGDLLQPSAYILEDLITVSNTGRAYPEVIEYKTATSSLITRRELVELSTLAEAKLKCTQHSIDVTMFDPFSQQPYSYHFDVGSLKHFLVIPNQYGYGIDLSCVHDADSNSATEVTTTNLKIACVPNKEHKNLATDAAVHCFRSSFHQRIKRALNAPPPEVIYQPPQPTDMVPSLYNGYIVGGGANDVNEGPSSTTTEEATSEGSTTTAAEPETTTTEPEPPAPPPPPLPKLRQILKTAEPFIGACIGASLGCAICVIILGQLPFNVLPALCTGPCFTQTFGQCGGLLGRVGAETTVICTELFRQGYIEVDTFIADVEFGKVMAEESPMTLKGYQFLASPLVYLMRSSNIFASLVAKATKPWAAYMQHSLGHGAYEDTTDIDMGNLWLGEWIHWIGVPICTVTGYLLTFSELFYTAYNGDARMVQTLVIVLLSFCGALILLVRRKSNS